mmetsp:Transcript_128565/g.320646  ORF Transcript_128565/g.320646 Transcript_128565/m.320646 type:complete len:102 (-) Transcript_128565:670-975(-)
MQWSETCRCMQQALLLGDCCRRHFVPSAYSSRSCAKSERGSSMLDNTDSLRFVCMYCGLGAAPQRGRGGRHNTPTASRHADGAMYWSGGTHGCAAAEEDGK